MKHLLRSYWAKVIVNCTIWNHVNNFPSYFLIKHFWSITSLLFKYTNKILVCGKDSKSKRRRKKSGAGKLFQYTIVVIFTFFVNLGIVVFLFVKFYGRAFLPDNLNFYYFFTRLYFKPENINKQRNDKFYILKRHKS